MPQIDIWNCESSMYNESLDTGRCICGCPVTMQPLHRTPAYVSGSGWAGDALSSRGQRRLPDLNSLKLLACRSHMVHNLRANTATPEQPACPGQGGFLWAISVSASHRTDVRDTALCHDCPQGLLHAPCRGPSCMLVSTWHRNANLFGIS